MGYEQSSIGGQQNDFISIRMFCNKQMNDKGRACDIASLEEFMFGCS